jgi:hypothetical protein
MGPGDVHTIILDWDNPLKATVYIDRGGNGIIDEIIELPNRPLGTIFMPIIRK